MDAPLQTHAIPRDLLEKYFGDDPRLISAFENQALAVMETLTITGNTVEGTEALQNATVLTLSPNAAFNNEFVLGPGDGTVVTFSTGSAQIDVDDTVARSEGPKVTFAPPGEVVLGLPAEGTLLSDHNPIMFQPLMPGLINAGSDAAAATAGVPLDGVYRNGGVLHVRVT